MKTHVWERVSPDLGVGAPRLYVQVVSHAAHMQLSSCLGG